MLISVGQQYDHLFPAHYVGAMGLLGVALAFWPLSYKGWQVRDGAKS